MAETVPRPGPGCSLEAQPAEGPISTPSRTLSEEAWNEEAAHMIDDALKTQQEVADYLKFNDQASKDLGTLKAKCDEELEDLQEEAWRLSMYTELERLRLQLSLLQPLEDDMDPRAAAAAAAADEEGEAPSGDEDDSSLLHKAVEDLTLNELDAELAAVDAQLRVAKEQLLLMMAAKADLHNEMAEVFSHQDEGAAAGHHNTHAAGGVTP